MNELTVFGQFDSLDVNDFTFQIIQKYVQNSHGLPIGAEVTIHNVYELIKSDYSMSTTLLAPKMNKNSSRSTEGCEQMLLWFKTTPAGIKKLAHGTDGCVALYDRICRAFTEKPENLQAPLRQIFLLCEVSLGKVYNDLQGYQRWSRVGQAPSGFDTIKGIGSFCPDWNENYSEGFVVFPCGPTVKQQGFRKYEINFNEYIVFERNRIKIKYAVELDLIPLAYLQKSSSGIVAVDDSSDDRNSSISIASGSNSSFSTAVPQASTRSSIYSPVNQPFVRAHQSSRGNRNAAQPNLRRALSNSRGQQKPSCFHQGGSLTRNHSSSLGGSSTPVTAPNLKPNLTRMPSQTAVHPFNSTARGPVPTSNHFGHSSHLRFNPPSPTQPQYHPLPPLTQPKKNKVDPAALKILMQLPGATSVAFQTSLFKAQIITPVEQMYDHIHTYVRNSSVHNYKLKPLSIIRIVRKNEYEFEHDPNMKGKKRLLLWHGTKDNVVAGILQTGFQIPAAKNQMFGTGIYFADRASKSANYCTHTKPPGIGYLLLCDVAIGNPYNSLNAKSNFTAPPTTTTKTGVTKYFDSLKCTGEYIPDGSENVYCNGTVIPLGKTIKNTKYESYKVKYNEFIVYDSKKIRIKYLVKVQFT
ncbi:unnamed protein product [Orchesella dallaii]